MTGSTQLPGERQLAVDLFNGVWTLLGAERRTVADDDRMLHMAHASRYHWGQVGSPENLARGEWLCSRVYAVLGRAEPCRHHAERVLELCRDHGIGDWDLAFGYEALARAFASPATPSGRLAPSRRPSPLPRISPMRPTGGCSCPTCRRSRASSRPPHRADDPGSNRGERTRSRPGRGHPSGSGAADTGPYLPFLAR